MGRGRLNYLKKSRISWPRHSFKIFKHIGALRFNPPRELTVKLSRLFYGKGIEMSVQPEISSLAALVADPAKAATLTPERAQALLIGLASIHPILLQRALAGSRNGREEDLLLTIPQVAKRLKVSDYRAYELARQGTLKSVRLGKSVRVKPSAIDEYVSQHGT